MTKNIVLCFPKHDTSVWSEFDIILWLTDVERPVVGGREGCSTASGWPAGSSEHLLTSPLMEGPSLFLHRRLPYCHTVQHQNLPYHELQTETSQSSQMSQLWENNFIHMFSLSWPSQMFTRGWKPLPGSTQVERIDNTYNNFQGISNDWLLYRSGCTDLPCSTSW